MTKLLLLFALAACQQPAPRNIANSACASSCSSSAECDRASACSYCSLGHCSRTLPADPTKDAGVDAPGGTTP